MPTVEALQKLVTVLTNQRNFAFDQLAQLEALLLSEREAHASSKDDPAARLPAPGGAKVIPAGLSASDKPGPVGAKTS